MTALVQAALRVRRTARSAWGLAAALLLAAFLLAGFFLPGSRALGWGHLAWVVTWSALFGYRVRNAYQHGTDPRSAFELGVLLLVGVHAVVQLRGGVGSDLYPLTYVAVALVASFITGRAGIGGGLPVEVTFHLSNSWQPSCLRGLLGGQMDGQTI